jgi:hypothetical protein
MQTLRRSQYDRRESCSSTAAGSKAQKGMAKPCNDGGSGSNLGCAVGKLLVFLGQTKAEWQIVGSACSCTGLLRHLFDTKYGLYLTRDRADYSELRLKEQIIGQDWRRGEG